MAAEAPAPPSPSVTYVLADKEGVDEIKRMMASGTIVDASLKIEVPRLERLDAAPGICRALGKALGRWKRRVAPDLVCHVLKYFKLKAAAAISRDLRSVSTIIGDIRQNPANLPLYRRITDIANKILRAAPSLPEPARRRVRRVANRVLRLAARGEKYGETRPEKIRNRAAVTVGKIGSLQAKAVVLKSG